MMRQVEQRLMQIVEDEVQWMRSMIDVQRQQLKQEDITVGKVLRLVEERDSSKHQLLQRDKEISKAGDYIEELSGKYEELLKEVNGLHEKLEISEARCRDLTVVNGELAAFKQNFEYMKEGYADQDHEHLATVIVDRIEKMRDLEAEVVELRSVNDELCEEIEERDEANNSIEHSGISQNAFVEIVQRANWVDRAFKKLSDVFQDADAGEEKLFDAFNAVENRIKDLMIAIGGK